MKQPPTDIENEMIRRALQSEKDISEGRVYTLEEAEDRINSRIVLLMKDRISSTT